MKTRTKIAGYTAYFACFMTLFVFGIDIFAPVSLRNQVYIWAGNYERVPFSKEEREFWDNSTLQEANERLLKIQLEHKLE